MPLENGDFHEMDLLISLESSVRVITTIDKHKSNLLRPIYIS